MRFYSFLFKLSLISLIFLGSGWLLLGAMMPVSATLRAQSLPGQATELVTETVVLFPSKDNTLYEATSAFTSNGQGEFLFVGDTASGSKRRALLAFPITSSIPATATIISVTLTLDLSKTSAGEQAVALHRLEQNWGEGTSNAGANEGKGAAATAEDATWAHSFFSRETWLEGPGGNFTTTASATLNVGGQGSYTWDTTPRMVADVQGWLNTPNSNFGWLLLGNEANSQTAKRFNSRENTSATSRPRLTIRYQVEKPVVVATATPTALATTAATGTPTVTPVSTGTPVPTPTSPYDGMNHKSYLPLANR